jgi:hypothetical protein
MSWAAKYAEQADAHRRAAHLYAHEGSKRDFHLAAAEVYDILRERALEFEADPPMIVRPPE